MRKATKFLIGLEGFIIGTAYYLFNITKEVVDYSKKDMIWFNGKLVLSTPKPWNLGGSEQVYYMTIRPYEVLSYILIVLGIIVAIYFIWRYCNEQT